MNLTDKPPFPFSSTITVEHVLEKTHKLMDLIDNNSFDNLDKVSSYNDAQNIKKVYVCSNDNEKNKRPHNYIHNDSFQYKLSPNENFVDRNIFTPTCSKFTQEAESIAKISYLLEEAEEYASVLYTWRSCTIPLPKNMSEEGVNASVDLIEKEVEKLKNFYLFQREAVEIYRNEVIRLVNASNEYNNTECLLMLVRLSSWLSTLDELKNIKASVKNDFAHYKRLMGKRPISHEKVDQLRDISLFLASHNAISLKVKEVMSVANGYQDLFCQLINFCVSRYESNSYILPREKYDIVKVIGFLLYMLDGSQFNINKTKKVNLSKIDSILKEVEVIPLYGDTVFSAFKYIERSTNYDSSHWPKCSSSEISSQSSLASQMTQFRQQHTNVVMEFVSKLSTNEAKIDLSCPDHIPFNEHMIVCYDLTFKALQTMSQWTCAVLEMISWKMTHPTEASRGNHTCPPDATNFEKATKYNYTNEDKSNLVEMIGFINDIKKLMKIHFPHLNKCLLHRMFQQLQSYLNVGLSEPIRKANKHHKNLLHSFLTAIQNSGVDTSSVLHVAEGKKPKKGHELFSIKSKQAKTSLCQLYLIRSITEYLIDKSNPKNPGRDVDSSHMKAIKEFFNQSHNWKYLIQLEESIDMSCDLSQLWYREFYLEMTKGEEIQFPIEQSLIWILSSFILDKKDSYLTHFLMVVFDLYNQSANCALYTFKKKHLFSEIEAEALLCFEQLVFKLSERLYESYRTKAAMVILSKKFSKIHANSDKTNARVEYFRILLQKNFQLLGRSVNLKQRMTKCMNDFTLKALNAAISRFECGSIKGVMELTTLLEITKETHKLLKKYLELDDYQNLWLEANHNVTSSYGRVCIYILLELTSDFLPHYCYNSSTGRFIFTVLPFAETTVRDKLPTHPAYLLYGNKTLAQDFASVLDLYSSFFGAPHMYAILDLLGYQDVAMLTKELLENTKTLLKNTLIPYITSLQAVMPEKQILPSYSYTSPGVLGYYEIQLEGILAYSDLQPKVFQCLREIGNTVIFVMLVEQYQTMRESIEYNMSAMFLKVFPKPYIVDDGSEKTAKDKAEEREKLEKSMEVKYRFQHIYPVMAKNASPEQFSICKDNYLLTKDKLSLGLSIFPVFLRMLKEELEKFDPSVFRCNSRRIQTQDLNEPDEDGKIHSYTNTTASVWSVEMNGEFHRLWSAMQFVMCRTQGQHELTVEQLFGEGLNWGGCTLVYLLGQELRLQCMDVCYHLHNVNRVDQVDKVCAGVNLRKMVDRIRKFQILNDQIFACLAKHCCDEDDINENNNDNNNNNIKHWSHLISNSRNNNRPTVEHIDPAHNNNSDVPLTIIERVG